MLLGIAGMVGSGKTTLARALASRFGLQLALESIDEDNPWLEPFYSGADGMKTYALHLQLHFLATRFASMRRMRGLGGSWVLDRTWYEDAEVFAAGHFEQGLLSKEEWQLYRKLYAELLYAPAARPPRMLIYLYAPLETILARIAERGRPKEREADRAYWEQLHARYAKWIHSFRHCPVLFIDVREYDLFKDASGAAEGIASRVQQRLEKELPQTELWPAAAPRQADLGAFSRGIT
jgi:deoxyadenosine/deoxycytidine kinase